jgi:hypothetical protein
MMLDKKEAEKQMVGGVCEPPQDYRVFNRRQPDGSFRPLSEYFERPSPARRLALLGELAEATREETK